jgi:glutamine amidotransferase
MSKSRVVLVDYGVGNLLSVSRAFSSFGEHVIVSSDSKVIASADKIILPGVGAYKNAMSALFSLNLVDVLKEAALQNKSILGICLGMQLLLSESEEFGQSDGLDLIDGKVKKIPSTFQGDASIKIPHIGWSAISTKGDSSEKLLNNSMSNAMYYFVHSYYASPTNCSSVVATANYFGVEVPAIIRRGNIVGCQFHPEKSGPHGLNLLKNFFYD